MIETNNKRWLCPSELEIEYGFSKSAQAKMRMASSSSTLPFSKIGRYIRYDRLEINKWLEEHQIQGVPMIRITDERLAASKGSAT